MAITTASETSSSTAPHTADSTISRDGRCTPAARNRFGAISPTKPTGPARPIAIAVSQVASTTHSARNTWGRNPSRLACSSPSRIRSRPRASTSASANTGSASRQAVATPPVPICCNDPVLHSTMLTAESSLMVSTSVSSALSASAVAAPARVILSGEARHPPATANVSPAAARPPTKIAGATGSALQMKVATSPSCAPVVTPSRSLDASGLCVTVCSSAPAMPNAAPASAPASARGKWSSRNSSRAAEPGWPSAAQPKPDGP